MVLIILFPNSYYASMREYFHRYLYKLLLPFPSNFDVSFLLPFIYGYKGEGICFSENIEDLCTLFLLWMGKQPCTRTVEILSQKSP